MPELLQKFVRARAQGAWLLGWAIALAVFPASSWAESSPARMRSVCAAETDPTQRLACYDKENASVAVPAPKVTSAGVAGAAGAPRSAPAAAAGSTSAAGPASAARASAGREPQVPAVDAPKPQPTKPASADKEAQHLTARVVSIDNSPNEMVLHLDNGQVWQQMQQVSGDLSLRAGDTVRIDKQFGSYYLKGPHVAGMKVRQKT